MTRPRHPIPAPPKIKKFFEEVHAIEEHTKKRKPRGRPITVKPGHPLYVPPVKREVPRKYRRTSPKPLPPLQEAVSSAHDAGYANVYDLHSRIPGEVQRALRACYPSLPSLVACVKAALFAAAAPHLGEEASEELRKRCQICLANTR
jgi:hypothetical protein